METEEKELLENTLKLVEENNKMLHKIRRHQKIASFSRFIYWLFIAGIGVGAFYFIQPYIEEVQSFVGKTSSNINELKEILPR
jgi:hypothetical protein